MLSLFLRNLLFTILHPGIIAGLIPYLILSREDLELIYKPFNLYQYAGIIISVTGFIILIKCIIGFAVKGKGTLSPFDPTKELVISGLYRYSRNPMYLGVMLILSGETVFFTSTELLVYEVVVFLLFNVFIKVNEEPRLKKDFGDTYLQYCNKVRRWI